MKLKSFTIIELLVSIMIIGILSSIGYQQYTKAIMKANAAATVAQLKAMEAAMAKYYADTGTMPGNIEYLFNIPSDANGSDLFGYVINDEIDVTDYWAGPYIETADMTMRDSEGNETDLLYSGLSCTSGTIKQADADTGNHDWKCYKSKLGGRICTGAKIDNNTTTYNVFIIDGLNVDMAKELFTAVNNKAPKNNAAKFFDSSVSNDEKLGIGDMTDYSSETGCAAYKFYDSSLVK